MRKQDTSYMAAASVPLSSVPVPCLAAVSRRGVVLPVWPSRRARRTLRAECRSAEPTDVHGLVMRTARSSLTVRWLAGGTGELAGQLDAEHGTQCAVPAAWVMEQGVRPREQGGRCKGRAGTASSTCLLSQL